MSTQTHKQINCDVFQNYDIIYTRIFCFNTFIFH